MHRSVAASSVRQIGLRSIQRISIANACQAQQRHRHDDSNASQPEVSVQQPPEKQDAPQEKAPKIQEKKLTIAERDAALMGAWQDHEGSLANAEFQDGKVEEGYRRNVKANIFRYI